MKPWILALILTIVVFGAIQLFGKNKQDNDNDNVKSYNELPTQIATFGTILLLSFVLCYWFDSGNSISTTLSSDINAKSIEAEMIKHIREEITVGLPPF